LVSLTGGDAELARDIAMRVAAVNPQVVRPEDMPEDVVTQEKNIIKAQPDMEGKPEAIVEKMMIGRINKFLKENSLLEQAFVKDPEITIGKLAKNAGAEVVSFVRYEVGEGIEKEEIDFAAEVAAQLNG
jgi:elongation factor Ts